MVNKDLEKVIVDKYNYLLNRFEPKFLKEMKFLGDNKEIIKRKKILYKSIRLYAEAKSLKELCKLNMQFFSGKIFCPTSPGELFNDPMYPKGVWAPVLLIKNYKKLI